MPVKDIEKLGESKTVAIKRLDQLWKRLSRDEAMKNLYQDFMQEYLDLGHMEKVNDVKSASPLCYCLPHHGVFRPEKQQQSFMLCSMPLLLQHPAAVSMITF
ncbi:hypothetical protein AVEN_230357-1 [Araneus ventricosus]|uniref:Uncharacterized protein n=1 Tax=Araneus ventricosus TaxID=182803 RepID=A0A4Y2I5C8_ARAVE|nr:hypothetical protein AVEN_230357-1 [Araneus ventricosus]